jgi:hypothetical protein
MLRYLALSKPELFVSTVFVDICQRATNPKYCAATADQRFCVTRDFNTYFPADMLIRVMRSYDIDMQIRQQPYAGRFLNMHRSRINELASHRT